MTADEKIKLALDVARDYAGFDGGHHKQWVIDQMVRALHGNQEAESNEAYEQWIKNYQRDPSLDDPEVSADLTDEEREEMENAYEWDQGIPP